MHAHARGKEGQGDDIPRPHRREVSLRKKQQLVFCSFVLIIVKSEGLLQQDKAGGSGQNIDEETRFFTQNADFA